MTNLPVLKKSQKAYTQKCQVAVAGFVFPTIGKALVFRT